MASDRPAPKSTRDPAFADTLLAESGIGSRGDDPTVVPHQDSSAPAFELAQGEQAVIPVTIELDVPEPETTGRYEEGPVLGAGGMGEVRLWRDPRIGRHVAGKTLHTTNDAPAKRRFLREARIQGQLEHPAIVPVYDIDEDSAGQPFFTMKRVRGLTLAKIVDRLADGDEELEKRHSRRRLLSAMVQVCHAIEYAHERGVVHRDIKPGNIMLGDYGEVYVLDWGVARVLKDQEVQPENKIPAALEASVGITRQGDLVGSLGYMAPEQMMGEPDLVNVRADVFALGVVLFEVLTLHKFRPPAAFGVMLDRVYQGERQRPLDVRTDVPPELDEICARCTSPSPKDRYASAGEIADALERYLEGDRDREARRHTAHELTHQARTVLSDSKRSASERVEAMRQVVRALALDPEATEAQALLVESLVDVKGPPPPEAEAELALFVERLRARGGRLGTFGYLTMLAAVPFALWIGVKSWPAVIAMTLVNCACAALCHFGSSSGGSPRLSVVLAACTGALMAITSAVAGPFVAVPALAAGIATFFAAHVSSRERRIATALITLGAVLPFAVEALGWFSPAYAFEPGRIVLFARAVEFPEVPMLLALLYSSASSVALPAIFTGWVHDERMSVQRRMILQTWQLKQLFPDSASRASLLPPG
jgi:serine/threonine protein kinase